MKKWTNILSITIAFLFATNMQAQWLTNGSNLYYNAGSVGIGTSTPSYKLHVDGEIYSYLNNTLTVPQFTIEKNGTGDAAMRFVLTGGASWSLGIDNSLGDFFRISPGSNGIDSSAPFVISTDGNVGIGTSSPTTKLHVNGISQASTFRSALSNTDFHHFTRNGTGSAVYINQVSDGPGFPILRLSSGTASANSNVKFTVENDGSVGIGTTTPTEKLHVVGNTSIDDGSIYINYSAYDRGGYYLKSTHYGNQYKWWQESDGLKLAVYNSSDYTTPVNPNLILFRSGGNKVEINGLVSIQEDVGIGTSTPRAKFDIYHTQAYDTQEFFTGQDHILLSSINPGNGNYFGGVSWTNGQRRRASIAAVMENADSDYVGLAFFTRGVDGPGPFYESMRIAHNGNVGIGTTAPTEKLAVNGKIRSKEVIVEATGWPDYVFEAGYKLPTLAEIEAYIKANKHLPGIPSAEQVEEQGQSVGEIQKQLLKKMEEMTLHMIELKKENETLIKRIEQLEKTNNK